MTSVKRAANTATRPWGYRRIPTENGSRSVAVITCAMCGTQSTINLGVQLPPQVITQKFGEQKWALKPNRAICPSCIGKLKTSRGEKMNTVPPASVTVRDLNPGEHRRVMSLLEAHFDEKSGRYVNKYSDQTIADEVKVPRAAVKSLRERYFGPLKADPEITAIREEIDRMLGKLADLSARLDRVEKQAT